MNKYYAVLGLPSTASKEEIRKKYRQLVLVWHPDRNSSPEAPGKFIAITEAYDILMGERAVPRSKSNYSWPRAQPKPAQQQRPRPASKAELMRKKFEKLRDEQRRSPKAKQTEQELKSKATMYFVLTGAIAFVMIALPVIGGLANLIWTLPVGFGLGAQSLWKGGRFKLRSEMIFGSKSNFTDEEIAEFFVDRPGFGSHNLWKDDRDYF